MLIEKNAHYSLYAGPHLNFLRTSWQKSWLQQSRANKSMSRRSCLAMKRNRIKWGIVRRFKLGCVYTLLSFTSGHLCTVLSLAPFLTTAILKKFGFLSIFNVCDSLVNWSLWWSSSQFKWYSSSSLVIHFLLFNRNNNRGIVQITFHIIYSLAIKYSK